MMYFRIYLKEMCGKTTHYNEENTVKMIQTKIKFHVVSWKWFGAIPIAIVQARTFIQYLLTIIPIDLTLYSTFESIPKLILSDPEISCAVYVQFFNEPIFFINILLQPPHVSNF